MKVKVTQLCPTLCDPMDCGPPGSSVHGIHQARILEWVAISFSRVFPTQGLNLGLLHCRQILYYLSHQGSLWISIKAHKCLSFTLGVKRGCLKSPGEGNSFPLQYSCLENSMEEKPGRLQSLEADMTERLSTHVLNENNMCRPVFHMVLTANLQQPSKPKSQGRIIGSPLWLS